MLPLEELDDGLLYGLRRREFGEHLGSFVEIRDLSIAVHGDDAVFQAGKNLLPGDFATVTACCEGLRLSCEKHA